LYFFFFWRASATDPHANSWAGVTCTLAARHLRFHKSVQTAQDHRSFNNVLQLADISRPDTTGQSSHAYCCRSSPDFCGLFSTHFFSAYSFTSMAQYGISLRLRRGGTQCDNVQPVKQVARNVPAAMSPALNPVGCGYDETVGGNNSVPPLVRTALLKYSQQSIRVLREARRPRLERCTRRCAIFKRPGARCTRQ